MRREELIEQYKQLHASKPYGRSSELKARYVQRELMYLDTVDTILDFGCGQSRLVDWLAKMSDAQGLRYDPAIPAYDTKPTVPCDAVVCTDVLEHIPEENVISFLQDIRAITQNAYFNVSIRAAIEILPNGENAHCTVKPADWWGQKIADVFGFARRSSSNDSTAVTWVTWRKPE
ncbi:MAG: methyltransferase domain-containing protein [Planktomarina sp.]